MIYIYILQQQDDNVEFETSQIDPNKFSIYVMSNIFKKAIYDTYYIINDKQSKSSIKKYFLNIFYSNMKS